MTHRQGTLNCLLVIFALVFIIVYKVFASTQSLTPNGDGPTVADGATGHWTTYGSGSSAWGRLDNGAFDTGVSESTVNDSCNFEFDDFTLPAAAVVSLVEVYSFMCLRSGTSATVRVDVCDGTACVNGSAEAVGTPEAGDCDQSYYKAWTTAPDGSGWDQTDINNIRIRLILTAASGAGTAGVSEIDIAITYSIPSGGMRRAQLLKVR